jgi:transcriptional regulator
MYLPERFEAKDQKKIVELIQKHAFATLLTVNNGEPFINHIPLVIDEDRSDCLTLLGHMSTRNPQAQLAQDGESITAIFQGPHTYVTPSWYAENDVPTWNYMVVHVKGRIRWIKEFKPLVGLLKKQTTRFESDEPNPWRMTLPDDLKSESELTSAIVGFEIEAESIEAKFKLSQNRSQADREGVIQGLAGRSDEMSRLVREAMLNLS